MKRFILIGSLLLSGCTALTKQPELERGELITEAVWQAINVADAITTARIHKTPGVREVNPVTSRVLGEQPDPDEVAVYFATVGLSHFLILKMLPPKWRKFYQGSTLAMGLATVDNNCQLDLC